MDDILLEDGREVPKCITLGALPFELSHTITPGLHLNYTAKFPKLWECLNSRSKAKLLPFGIRLPLGLGFNWCFFEIFTVVFAHQCAMRIVSLPSIWALQTLGGTGKIWKVVFPQRCWFPPIHDI